LIKAIALDIDGTITFEDRRLDIEAVKAIRKAEEVGLPVILATGNVLSFAEFASIWLGTTGPLIAEDGGIVYLRKTDELILLGNREEAERGLKALERRFGKLTQTKSSKERLTGLTLERTLTAQQAMEVFKQEGLNLVAVDSGFAIHIRSPEINKGTALKHAASLLDLSTHEIAAIGDAPNDVEMLQTAGLSFAVANSHETVKQVCTRVTASPYGKGVAEAIEEILKL